MQPPPLSKAAKDRIEIKTFPLLRVASASRVGVGASRSFSGARQKSFRHTPLVGFVGRRGQLPHCVCRGGGGTERLVVQYLCCCSRPYRQIHPDNHFVALLVRCQRARGGLGGGGIRCLRLSSTSQVAVCHDTFSFCSNQGNCTGYGFAVLMLLYSFGS